MSERHQLGAESKGMEALTTDMFSLILSLRHRSDYGEAEHLIQQITQHLNRMEQEGVAAGFTREDLDSVRFALVVFADEIILGSQWVHREEWRDRPLQLSLFGERRGGARFFTELEKLRRQGEFKREVLEVYHLCLALGFEGQYMVSGRTMLDATIADLRSQLGYDPRDTRELKLSPHGKPRDRSVAVAGDTFPFWRIAAFSSALLVLLFVIYFFITDFQTGKAIDSMPNANVEGSVT